MATFKIATLSTLVVLGAHAVHAQCPSNSDLNSGIRLENKAAKFRSDFSRKSTDAHLIENRRSPYRGKIAQQTTWYVNGLMPGATTRGGGMTKMVYPRDATKQVLNLPKRNFSIQFQIYRDGQKLEPGRTNYRYEGKGHIKLGRCSYEVWIIHADTRFGKIGRSIWRQYYAPELDVSLRSEKLDEKGAIISRVGYNSARKLR